MCSDFLVRDVRRVDHRVAADGVKVLVVLPAVDHNTESLQVAEETPDECGVDITDDSNNRINAVDPIAVFEDCPCLFGYIRIQLDLPPGQKELDTSVLCDRVGDEERPNVHDGTFFREVASTFFQRSGLEVKKIGLPPVDKSYHNYQRHCSNQG